MNYYKLDGKRSLIYVSQIDKYISKLSFNKNHITKIKFLFSIILNSHTTKYFMFSLKVLIKLILFKKYSYPEFKFKNKKKFDHRITDVDVKNLNKKLSKYNVI